nr:hypothetical protein [Candidatus Freyarchaeota archaeon]
MFSLAEFIIYAYFFNDVFRLSAVFGVSSGMYTKLYLTAIASFVGFVVAALILVKSLKKTEGKLTYLYLFAAALTGGFTTLVVTIASYIYITCPSLFVFIPETISILYRIEYVLIPIIALFFWLFFAQLIQIKRAVVYTFVIFCLIALFMNLIGNITMVEEQLRLSVYPSLITSLITMINWISVFLIFAVSFYHYATKQKGELRVKALLFGTGGVSATLQQVTLLLGTLFHTELLKDIIWVFAIITFASMYFGLFPPKRLLPKTKGK